MAADKTRKQTEVGLGAVRSSRPPRQASGVDISEMPAPDSGSYGIICPDGDPRALGARDTVLALPSVQPSASESGSRRRFTLDAQGPRRATDKGVAPPAEVPSTPPGGRYSSQSPDEAPAPESRPARAPKETLRRGERQAIRVDTVGSPRTLAAQDASGTATPRVLDRKRIATASLSARELLVVALVDGSFTVREIVDISALPEREVRATLAHLARLGIVTLEC